MDKTVAVAIAPKRIRISAVLDGRGKPATVPHHEYTLPSLHLEETNACDWLCARLCNYIQFDFGNLVAKFELVILPYTAQMMEK